ncbi:MAG: NAD+ synthase [Planctomycetota bacterium]
MRIALAQFNASVGDLQANTALILKAYTQALQQNIDLLVFPEMSLCGYPPEDLLLRKSFLSDNQQALSKLAARCTRTTMIIGFPENADSKCYNALAVLQNGAISGIYRKCLLPNYAVFDEKRYFLPGTDPLVITVNGVSAALTICEDIWDIEWLEKFLGHTSHFDIILSISASPFHVGKITRRSNLLSRCAAKFNCPVGYCNLVGGQDELVFDGRSMFIDSNGKIVGSAKAFQEDMLVADITAGPERLAINIPDAAYRNSACTKLDTITEVYHALILGTADYIRKNGFSKVIVGLSGGIDSSVTAAIAVEAIGRENVVAITMPSQFNSDETISDSQRQAQNLGIEFHKIPITEILHSFDKTLGFFDTWNNSSIAYENLQARIRGSILMSLSNQLGYLVLTTGNKSETAVGYSTLYGDTAGGFAVIKDLPKTMVYKLAKHINQINNSEIIPATVIERPPTAELRPNQKDTDSLPDYDLLDKILKGYVEEDKSAQQLVNEDRLPADVVNRVIALVDRNEYKRRQCPPGIKITPKAFGKDRRLPITNRYTDRVQGA